MSKDIHAVPEYGSLHIDGYRLSEAEREYLQGLAVIEDRKGQERRFVVRELRTGLHLEATCWVGAIELERIRIVIEPKFHRGFAALLEMIAFIEGIPFHRRWESQSAHGKSDLMELFTRLYLDALNDLLKRGVVKEYVTEEDNLRLLRGRPDFVVNLQKNPASPDRIYCRYDELVTDIPENQVLLTALEAASRYRLAPATGQRLNRFRAEWEILCQPYREAQWPLFHYHRLNRHYQQAHRLAGYLFRQVATENLFRYHDRSFYSLLLNMNELFEDFVREVLRRYLPGRFRVSAQTKVRDAILSGGKTYRQVIPDLLVTEATSGTVLVLDTKYKNYGQKPVDTADIFQLAFYAQRFQSVPGQGHTSIILYPRYANQPARNDEAIDLLPGREHFGRLWVRDVPIEELLRLVRVGEREELARQALRLIGAG
ncbi:hypothetical protein GTO89_15850 [Heliobacterium gestii]|uniref:Restriction endonuclease n=1 Tax=Heliomicrobium gestii TaxID=2699 RepID=A0A845LNQ0_HELGE|nr:hypothetical protein [Heliomicrobium gestii]MBM7868340.1 5-methylcytosine-specific restriction enzyme subunit McrC [Heliomicrobium gestii]MZP44506.1 hypothetical protein [Heliomicrobium gestii]